MFFASRYRIEIKTKALLPARSADARVTDRQELVPGFDQQALSSARGVLIGAGGINSEVGEGLVRKGIGRLDIFDADLIELSNLNRQHFFKRDIGKPKGLRLAHNLANHATCGTVLTGYALSFQDALAAGIDVRGSFIVCGVDNNATRLAVAEHFYTIGIPVIFLAVDLHAEQGYAFVQEAGKACFRCVFPKATGKERTPCRAAASKDILKVVAGLALYAIDSLLMDRKRNWNYRHVCLAGFEPSFERWIERRRDCELCEMKSEVSEK
jgi:molybdopterin/thiamine biosynthesis adenylyltransferase